MNIFATDTCPVKSAQSLDDKRVVKMILETAQLLSCAVRHHKDLPEGLVYKVSHLNHPSSKWARATQGNFMWLVEHGLALCDVYRSAYYKNHKSRSVIEECLKHVSCIPKGRRQKFSLAIGSEFKVDRSVPVIAYRQYMNIKWSRDKLKPTWKNRKEPKWASLTG